MEKDGRTWNWCAGPGHFGHSMWVAHEAGACTSQGDRSGRGRGSNPGRGSSAGRGVAVPLQPLPLLPPLMLVV